MTFSCSSPWISIEDPAQYVFSVLTPSQFAATQGDVVVLYDVEPQTEDATWGVPAFRHTGLESSWPDLTLIFLLVRNDERVLEIEGDRPVEYNLYLIASCQAESNALSTSSKKSLVRQALRLLLWYFFMTATPSESLYKISDASFFVMNPRCHSLK